MRSFGYWCPQIDLEGDRGREAMTMMDKKLKKRFEIEKDKQPHVSPRFSSWREKCLGRERVLLECLHIQQCKLQTWRVRNQHLNVKRYDWKLESNEAVLVRCKIRDHCCHGNDTKRYVTSIYTNAQTSDRSGVVWHFKKMMWRTYKRSMKWLKILHEKPSKKCAWCNYYIYSLRGFL